MPGPVLRVEIRASALLAIAFLLIHSGAAAAIWAAPLAAALQVAVTGAVVAHFAVTTWSYAALRAKGAIVALEAREAGALSVRSRAGAWRECELLGSSFASPWLIVLNLRPAGSRRPQHVVLVADNADRNDVRRLRVWLRWAVARESGRAG